MLATSKANLINNNKRSETFTMIFSNDTVFFHINSTTMNEKHSGVIHPLEIKLCLRFVLYYDNIIIILGVKMFKPVVESRDTTLFITINIALVNKLFKQCSYEI